MGPFEVVRRTDQWRSAHSLTVFSTPYFTYMLQISLAVFSGSLIFPSAMSALLLTSYVFLLGRSFHHWTFALTHSSIFRVCLSHTPLVLQFPENSYRIQFPRPL